MNVAKSGAGVTGQLCNQTANYRASQSMNSSFRVSNRE